MLCFPNSDASLATFHCSSFKLITHNKINYKRFRKECKYEENSNNNDVKHCYNAVRSQNINM